MSRGIALGCALLTGALLLANACSNGGPKPDTVEPAPAQAVAPPPPVAPTPAPVPPPAVPPTAVTTTVSARISPDAGAAPSPTVKLVVRTFPGKKGVVMWGGKRLGFVDRNMPLVIERPPDSGPLDLVIRVTDYVPVHTRAYTFSDAASP